MTFHPRWLAEDEGRRVTQESLIQPAGWREGTEHMEDG